MNKSTFLKIAKKVFADTATPWGVSQSSVQIIRGLVSYSTASHGGLRVSPSLANKLTRYTLQRGRRYGNGYWYEQSCDYALPLYELWDEYSSKIKAAYGGNISKQSLEKTIRNYYSNYPFDAMMEDDNGLPKLPLKVKDLKEDDILVIHGKKYIFKGIRYGSLYVVLFNNPILDGFIKESQYRNGIDRIIRNGKDIYER